MVIFRETSEPSLLDSLNFAASPSYSENHPARIIDMVDVVDRLWPPWAPWINHGINGINGK
jgi:hypothetical protein